MEKYVFSSTLTNTAVNYLLHMPQFEPIDCLVSQLDRSGVKKMLEFKKEGVVKSFFLDSGAFGIHKSNRDADIDEYIEYANSLDEHTFAIAELDTIPGKFGEPKNPEDYVESAEKSWESFLYMYDKMKSPQKLVPVFHYGEDFSNLKRMLEWRDSNGNAIDIIGISPANDTKQEVKDIYLRDVYDYMAKLGYSGSNVRKTHLFGMTALNSLVRFPCYSADSITHRLKSAHATVFTCEWGDLNVSVRSTRNKSKSCRNFIRTCDPGTYALFEKLLDSYNITVKEIEDSAEARVAVNIAEIQKFFRNTDRNGKPFTRTFKLF